MSAIIGIFNRDGAPVDEQILRRMMAASAPYGPDGQDLLISGPVGLGQLMLHVTPESLDERLPSRQGDLLITADARIDNRTELASSPGAAYLPPAAPDSELILHAYRQWGDECPRYLFGDFTFAIWDEQKQALFCAGDHTAARPLYYYQTPRLFLFSTDVCTLLAHPDVPHEPAEQVIAAYIAKPPFNITRETFYSGVTKLQAGHSLRVDNAGCRERRYWFPFDLPTLRLKTEVQYVEMLRDILTTAVASRVRTKFPVASHISGGLDSTGVAALAAQQLEQQNKRLAMGYSWAPPPGAAPASDDNRVWIEQAAARWNIPLHFVNPQPQDFISYIRRQPNVGGAPNYAPERRVAEHAAGLGVRVILSGWGGDQGITSGGSALARFLSRGRLIRFAQEAYRLRDVGGVKSHLKRSMASCLPDALYFRLMGTPLGGVETFIDPGFAARADGPFAAPAFRTYSSLRRTQRERANGLPLVPAVWTALGAPFGLVYAFPLLDRRVLEFAYTIPEDLYYNPGTSRYVYRAAISDILPKSIVWMRKSAADPQVDSRYPLWQGAWQLLAQQVQYDEWAMDIPWFNTPRLRSAILDVPSVATLHSNWRQFMALVRAAEMYRLYSFFYGDVTAR